MKKLVLASRSSRREILLKKAGLKIKVIPSRIKETPFNKNHFSAEHYAIRLALAKAENTAKRLKKGLIIGADTIVVLHNKIFGKPKNTSHAKKILSALSGTTHHVFTGVAVIDIETKKRLVDIEKTKIITRKISKTLINELAKKNHDKAGAYAVQENSDVLVKKIVGDYYNVVGLPLMKLRKILKNFSVEFPGL
ncbi:MAG: septum formation protein Maf [Candidatus Omnitrophica bacterium]|nr:septum formation protein Maf [Candidatus Omnitrophota bacterium]